MTLNRAPRRPGPSGLGLVLAAAWALGGVGPAAAQNDPEIWLADSPKAPAQSKSQRVLLRPNVEQSYHLFVNNPADKKVEVRVVLQGGPAENPVELLRSKPAAFDGTGTLPVAWDVAPAPPAPPGTPPPPPAETELKDVPVGEFRLVVLVDNKPVGAAVPVDLLRPADYLNLNACTVKFDGQRTVTATVVASAAFPAPPPAPVKLVLDPDRIPKLVPDTTLVGGYERSLTGPGKSVELKADQLKFDFPAEMKEVTGPVTITVDGYARALTFNITFKQGQEATDGREDKPILRIRGARYAPAAGKYPVVLMVDNARSADKVEIGLDRNRDGSFDEDEVQVLSGPRDQRVFFRPGPQGSLVFRTAVRDWAVDLDSAGVFGTTSVRLRLLDKEGKVVAGVEPVEQLVTFDSSPADVVIDQKEVADANKQLKRNDPLKVPVHAEDKESDIKEVLFFIGKPTPELTLPPGVETYPGKLEVLKKAGEKDKDNPKKADTWVAQLPVPADKAGKVPVAVQVTNGAGMKSFGTITIELQEAAKTDGKDAAAKGGTIEGTVTEDGRPQPNVPVVLLDKDGTEKDSTRTDKTGHYSFKEVPAGSYRLRATKVASKTQGEAGVQVVDKQTKEMDIKLMRK